MYMKGCSIIYNIPASYTVDHLLSGVQAKFVDCASKSCNLEIAHTCYAIPRLPGMQKSTISLTVDRHVCVIFAQKIHDILCCSCSLHLFHGLHHLQHLIVLSMQCRLKCIQYLHFAKTSCLILKYNQTDLESPNRSSPRALTARVWFPETKDNN